MLNVVARRRALLAVALAFIVLQMLIIVWIAYDSEISSLSWNLAIAPVKRNPSMIRSRSAFHNQNSVTIQQIYDYIGLGNTVSASSCELKTGMTALRNWDKTSKTFVSALNGRNEALLQCRVTNLEDQPISTQPHTICNASGLVLDPKKLTPAACPLFRPGYQCELPPTFYHYARGAFLFDQACMKEMAFSIEKFPRDHLRDIADSIDCQLNPNQSQNLSVVDGITLLVTRERGEHFNLFHAATDWLNAFVVIALLDLPLDEISVMFLDDHATSNLDIVWDTVFSRKQPVSRVSKFKNPLVFKKAVFVPPGYSSFLYKSNAGGLSCDTGAVGVGLMNAFSQHFLASFGITRRNVIFGTALNLLLVIRKPYEIGSFKHKFVGRQIENEQEVIAALQALPQCNLTVIDFSKVSLQEQLKAVASSDVLIGMHGAGLLHAFWLPKNGGLLEIMPAPDMGWRCFRNIAVQVGVSYDQYVNNRYPLDYREDQNGDYTTIDIEQIISKVTQLMSRIRNRMN